VIKLWPELAASEVATDERLPKALTQLATLHPRLCPRQVLGVRIGLYAADVLGVAVPQSRKRLLTIVETDGCFADGVSVATGCWLGRRTLRLADYGKVAATVIDTLTCRAVRIRPNRRARGLAGRYASRQIDLWHEQLIGYQTMPSEILLDVNYVWPDRAVPQILGQPGVRVPCEHCGEEILNGRELRLKGRTMCRACAGIDLFGPSLGLCSLPDA
jgi:formylmethanofuran dehydrogenase subunit E